MALDPLSLRYTAAGRGGLELNSYLENYRDELIGALRSLDLARIGEFIRILERARDEERTIFVFGNGGSPATAPTSWPSW